jgi:hypothetical protein
MRLRSIPSLVFWCAALLVPCSVFGQEYVPQLLETPLGYTRCIATESNDVGMVIGTCDGRAVAWRDGVPDVLPLPSGFTDSRGTGVNADGTVVGNCCVGTCAATRLSLSDTAACIWENGAVRLLPMPPARLTVRLPRLIPWGTSPERCTFPVALSVRLNQPKRSSGARMGR